MAHQHDSHSCGCDHHHNHAQEHSCGCNHEHHEHHDCCDHDDHKHGVCCCGHDHQEHEHGSCGCGHDHQEHEHGSCGCGHDHHEHGSCGCGHDHEHCGCGCGHDHVQPHRHEGLILGIGAGLFLLGFVMNFAAIPVVGTVLHVAAYLLLGLPVLTLAGKNILKGRIFDENFLMSVATIGAFFIGEVPEAVGVMLFYRVGEFFEHRASEGSRKSIMEAVDLRPEIVTLEDGRVIPASEAVPGMVLQVKPGDRIPLDGKVLTGESRIDTAPITGESVPVAVRPGSQLISGCVNGSGFLTMEAEKPLGESMVARILRSVEQAAASKPKMDRFITRFSRVYTPVVVALAAATAVIPSLITGDWNYWIYTALSFLVMSCPCALVISVPLAFFSGIGVASRKGILFKGGAAMETLSGVKVAALDKTGTLTEGTFGVLQIEGSDTLALAAACEQSSSHPIAKSIMNHALTVGIPVDPCTETEELAGLGIRAKVEGRTVLCGSGALMEQNGIQVPEVPGTVVYVARDREYLGFICVGDKLKAETPQAIRQIRKLGVEPVMLTGDNVAAARQIAREAGIEQVHGGLLPTQKLEQMQQLRREQGRVLFVGDGINDAPVLAGADVGAAMGGGADAAIEAADLVFMTGRTDAIADAIVLARKTRGIAWQNVYFAIGIKVAVMILGLLGMANLWLAVFADSGVAMLCVLNAIRLLYGARKK